MQLQGNVQTMIASQIYTVHLFMKSDYKSILIPIVSSLFLDDSSELFHRQTAFASFVGPVTGIRLFVQAFLWTWLHLLNCNVSNQYKSKAEDMLNKPWRPLPSNRVSEEAARRYRWTLPLICFGISAIFSWKLAAVSFCLTLTTIVYDEVGLAGHWFGKNLMGVSGYTCFELGSVMLMSKFSNSTKGCVGLSISLGAEADIDRVAFISILQNALIIFTTLHAQDFADVTGDKCLGRRTFPIVHPSASRMTISTALVAWSPIVCNVWRIDKITALAFTMLGCLTSARFWYLRTAEADNLSYILYNVSISF